MSPPTTNDLAASLALEFTPSKSKLVKKSLGQLQNKYKENFPPNNDLTISIPQAFEVVNHMSAFVGETRSIQIPIENRGGIDAKVKAKLVLPPGCCEHIQITPPNLLIKSFSCRTLTLAFRPSISSSFSKIKIRLELLDAQSHLLHSMRFELMATIPNSLAVDKKCLLLDVCDLSRSRIVSMNISNDSDFERIAELKLVSTDTMFFREEQLPFATEKQSTAEPASEHEFKAACKIISPVGQTIRLQARSSLKVDIEFSPTCTKIFRGFFIVTPMVDQTGKFTNAKALFNVVDRSEEQKIPLLGFGGVARVISIGKSNLEFDNSRFNPANGYLTQTITIKNVGSRTAAVKALKPSSMRGLLFNTYNHRIDPGATQEITVRCRKQDLLKPNSVLKVQWVDQAILMVHRYQNSDIED